MERGLWLSYPLPKKCAMGSNDVETITLIYDDSTINLIKDLVDKGVANVKLVKAYGDELPTPILITNNVVLTGMQAIQYIKTRFRVLPR